ncbi:MAG: efflux RND transporter periplasmic adaptor subunit [Pirellulales bacterium]
MNRSTNGHVHLLQARWGMGLVLLLAIGCTPQSPPSSNAVRPVKTMVVTAGGDERVRSFPGTVEASRRVELAFQVPGLLTELPVKEGQKVAKGDLIARLRQDEFQARLTQLQGQLDRARATLAALQAGERPEERLRRESQVRAANARLANARAELDRAKRLVDTRVIPRAEFEQIETAYRVAQEEHQAAIQLAEKGTVGREEEIMAQEAEVRGLEGRVVEANIQLADSTLTAPYDGVIARRFVEQGQNVRAKDPIVRFQDVDEVEIVVDVPENVMAADIDRADIVEMLAELSGAPGLTFPVEIREVAQVADPTTQTFKVRTAMRAPEGVRVLPGMTATVTATYKRASVLGERIIVPASAVAERDGRQIVWLVGSDGKVEPRAVKVGAASGGDVEITAGLAAGDRIATAGLSFLRKGMQVRDLGDALGSAGGSST